MRLPRLALGVALLVAPVAFAAAAAPEAGAPRSPEETLRVIYTEALVHGQAYDHLHDLVANCPGRLSGSKSLERAVGWARDTLGAMGLDRVYLQDVTVPHWERGDAESVFLLDPAGTVALTACALGGSGPTAAGGLLADVVEVHSIEELAVLGRARLEGKIVFFDRPMNPTFVNPMRAYGDAGDQRTHGPGEAAKYGAAGALVRSLTEAHNDVPHTGVTIFPEGTTKIPAAALSTIAADRLGAAIAEAKRNGTAVRVGMKINSQWYPDAPSHNVIGEIHGTEFPDQVIVVGGHLDCWDIAPGAQDDGAGVVQSIEVLRLFRALGIKPRHTLRCVLFVNEENGNAGGKAYARAAQTGAEKHLFAMETDSGGYDPRGFVFNGPDGDVVARIARWEPLFAPYNISLFRKGEPGTDVTPLFQTGVPAGELVTVSQRYFDIHHTRNDNMDQVNPRELQLGAAALASLLWLVDTQGL